ncbi:hypothetical protein [Streptomyces griseosporeus]|uniref:hypothetical protein n=1 Tax=Streptomyces griseosporeus TaxID=1910 RepID=UPI0037010232
MFKRSVQKIEAANKAAYDRRMKEIDRRMKEVEARGDKEREQIRKEVERRNPTICWWSTGIEKD